jgi:(R,R)-butanediol dehydrogenase / meso-butanediol dehydrogenase / diacetyl reductase
MKALVWKAIDEVAIEEIPEPEKSGMAIVRISYTGICGSDITIKSGKHPRARTPLVLGHEFTGTIEYVPPQLKRQLTLGRRVVVNPLISCKTCRPCQAGHEHICANLRLIGVEHNPGAFTARIAVPQPERIHPLPDSVPDTEGALIEPLAVAVHAVDYAEFAPGETAVVLGAGPIGLLVAQVARANGVKTLFVVETEPARLKRAERLGFTVIDGSKGDVVERVRQLTNNAMTDVTFDAAGVPATASQVIPLTGIKGRIVMVAIHKKPAEVAFRDLAYRELRILGTRIYATGNFGTAIDLVASGKVDLKPLITHVLPMREALRAFDIAQNDKEACKVLIGQDLA